MLKVVYAYVPIQSVQFSENLSIVLKARKSMVYAEQLREIGNTFMRRELGYDPGNGNGRQRPRNGGGPFLAVHMRRRDYIHARPGMIPSLEGAANQIKRLKSELGLERVFLATDASKEGM